MGARTRSPRAQARSHFCQNRRNGACRLVWQAPRASASPAECCLADQTRATSTTFASAAMHTSLGEDLRVALVRYRDQAIAGRRCPEAAAIVIRAEFPLEPVEFLHLLS